MGMKLSSISKNSRTFDFKFGGESMKVTYNNRAVTPEAMDSVRAESENDRYDYSLIELITRLVEKWELLDDNNKVVPITHEALITVPTEFLNELISGIQEDQKPGEAEPTSLGG